jgi:hypothetical protein
VNHYYSSGHEYSPIFLLEIVNVSFESLHDILRKLLEIVLQKDYSLRIVAGYESNSVSFDCGIHLGSTPSG